MRRPPRPRNEPLVGGALIWHMVLVAVLFLAGVFGMFSYAIDRGYSVELARTIAVNTIVVMEVFHLFFVRNIYGTSLTLRAVAGTPAVWTAVVAVAIGQFAITYVPFLQGLFGTAAGVARRWSRHRRRGHRPLRDPRDREADQAAPDRAGPGVAMTRPGHHTSLIPAITATTAITHSATRPQRAAWASDRPISATVSGSRRNAALAHPVHLGREPLGPLGEPRQFADQPAERADALGRELELAGGPEIAFDPVAHHRLRRRPHVEIGIERARHALDHHHRLLEEEQLGPRLHVEQLGHLEEQRQQPRHRDVARPLAVDRLADGAERLGEVVDRMRAAGT